MDKEQYERRNAELKAECGKLRRVYLEARSAYDKACNELRDLHWEYIEQTGGQGD